jgi:hypothetical protein
MNLIKPVIRLTTLPGPGRVVKVGSNPSERGERGGVKGEGLIYCNLYVTLNRQLAGTNRSVSYTPAARQPITPANRKSSNQTLT